MIQEETVVMSVIPVIPVTPLVIVPSPLPTNRPRANSPSVSLVPKPRAKSPFIDI